MFAIETMVAPYQELILEPLRLNTTLPPINKQVAPQAIEELNLPSTSASPAQPWHLHAPSGVPLKLLLELNPRNYRSADPLASVRPALALLLGLTPDLEHEDKTQPHCFALSLKAAAFVQAQAHLLFAQPPCSDFDFLHACAQQVKLQQAALGPIASTWLEQFSPQVQTRIKRNPAAHLFLLANLQWQQNLMRRNRNHHATPRNLGVPYEAPWALHAGLGLPLLKAAEAQHSGPLLTSQVVRVNLKALSYSYLRLEHYLNSCDLAELPQPIVTAVNCVSQLSNDTLLHYQIPEGMSTELQHFSLHLTQLSQALELDAPKLWPLTTDRAWSSALIQRRHLLQCYDMCLAVYARRHPDSIITDNVLGTTVALKRYGFDFVSAHPKFIAYATAMLDQSYNKRILGSLVPNTVLDLLALSSYVHAQDRHDALLRTTPFSSQLRSWDETLLDL